MIYLIAHSFQCVCHCIRTMFRVLGVYNFGYREPIFWLEQKQNLLLNNILNYYLATQFFRPSLIQRLLNKCLCLIGPILACIKILLVASLFSPLNQGISVLFFNCG